MDPFAVFADLVLTDDQAPVLSMPTGFFLATAERYRQEALIPATYGLCCRYGTCRDCQEPADWLAGGWGW